MKIFRVVILTISTLFCSRLNGQEEFGGKLGVNIQFGTHIQRFGLMYQIYYYKNHVQVSNGIYAHFNVKNLGPPGSHAEMQFHFGIQGQWISTDNQKYLLNETSNMSPFLNSIGYSFYWYVSENQTSQTTGSLYGAFDSFLFSLNNDAFGLNQIDDKFRTGGFYLAYQVDSVLFGIQNTLWTGKSVDAPKIDDPQYPGKHGYRDVSKAKYGNHSHGILAFRVDALLEYKQVGRGEIGVDAERIRHAFQNKFIHDGFSGRFVKSKNPHYPMINKEGNAYLFREKEKVRPSRLYFQIGLNQPLMY